MVAGFPNFKKKLKAILGSKITHGYLVIMGLFLIYLLLPSVPAPQIGERFPSESGFTSDLMGPPSGTYFTNLEKDEVVNFYLANYSRSSFLNLPLPVRAIEHKPEYASEIINDMHNAKNTSFLVEINQPFRESIILKGYGEVSQKEREEKNPKDIRSFTPKEGEKYFLQITSYQVKPSLWQRVLSWLVYALIVPLTMVFLWQRVKEIIELVRDLFHRHPKTDPGSKKGTDPGFRQDDTRHRRHSEGTPEESRSRRQSRMGSFANAQDDGFSFSVIPNLPAGRQIGICLEFRI